MPTVVGQVSKQVSIAVNMACAMRPKRDCCCGGKVPEAEYSPSRAGAKPPAAGRHRYDRVVHYSLPDVSANSEQADSMDVCTLPRVPYAALIGRHSTKALRALIAARMFARAPRRPLNCDAVRAGVGASGSRRADERRLSAHEVRFRAWEESNPSLGCGGYEGARRARRLRASWKTPSATGRWESC